MEAFLNYLLILFSITFTLANNQNVEETESTTENVSVAPAGVKTRKIYKLGRDPKKYGQKWILFLLKFPGKKSISQMSVTIH
uniref:Uncharacterized protein n=1 Tax=Meloidogyne enterolobii TaxID=390850 RepID=A0A6V7W6N1_MELEN|nr:unnamed protein product [Meloidogyne enterolobii]